MSLPPGFWDGVLRRLETHVPSGFLDGWVRPIAVEPVAGGLRLLCASPFHRDRLQGRYLPSIERCIAEEAGRDLRIEVALGAPSAPALSPLPAAGPTAVAAAPSAPGGVPAVRPVPKPARRPEPAQCQLPYRFETFVVGPCNALAREAAFAVAHGRQRRANPLFIASGVGLGKTHLARATLAQARAVGRERGLYVSAETFTNAFTRSVRRRETAERFKRRFRRDCELLVIEDVQFLRSKPATQLELFHTICHLLDVGARVVVTGDRMPREMEALDARLRSQLAAGLVAELEVPDAALRRDILRAKAAAGGVRLPDPCLDLLVEKVNGSVRDLEGVLIQLVESAALLKRAIDLELTRAAIHKIAPMSDARRLDVATVIGVVASATGTSREAMCARSQRRDVLQPRQLAMYLCHRYTDASLSEIATAFARRHPAVRNAIEVVERGVLERAPLRYQVERLVERLDGLCAAGARVA
jgi:chromosomal replication initiator protein